MICHPKGSEWRKWDLHAHTPLDHEWINSPQLNTDEEKKTFAEKYISFAKQQEIEVIGLTDHNFCNELKDSLYPYIIEEANKNGITILPGFEITVQDGSGIHLLVLFEEKTELSSIYDLVKRLFPLYLNLIPSTGRVPVSNKSIDQLIIELKDSKLNHLLIFAHGDRENGVLDKGTITGTRRVEEWANDMINICQLSKSKDEFEPNSFCYNVINGKDLNYKRDITYIVSSDCRSIDSTLNQDADFI